MGKPPGPGYALSGTGIAALRTAWPP
jgi:hypothetical protein